MFSPVFLLDRLCEPRRSSSQDQNTSTPTHFKDAVTETDPELIYGVSSHLHQRGSTERNTVTRRETETQGAPLGVQEILSLKNSEAGSEDSHEQCQGADCCKMCGRPFCVNAAEKQMKIGPQNIAPTNKNQTTGQSCCRICGMFFWCKRSFLKQGLRPEQSTDLCEVCAKHLNSVEVHTAKSQSLTECSDPENEVAESHKGRKESNRDGDKDESSRGSCSQKTKSKTIIRASNSQKRAKKKSCKDVSHLKHCCKVCGKSFCYRASFLKHVQEEDRDTDVCGVCGRCFETAESLRLHLQTYIRTNDCEVCGKRFDGLKRLEMHTRTHTGEKPYICGVCGKAFAQNGNLMGHMRVHTGEKPYVCSMCGQSFGFKEYMMAHMRIHTGEKPFLCSICGKEFRQRGTLKTHMMIHTGESTHRCVICDKTFYKSGALKIHMRAHTGEKPYLCNVCGKCFTAGSSLSKHMGVHEEQQTHRCSACCEEFTRKEDLKKHTQTHCCRDQLES